jgi:hypothetical protein
MKAPHGFGGLETARHAEPSCCPGKGAELSHDLRSPGYAMLVKLLRHIGQVSPAAASGPERRLLRASVWSRLEVKRTRRTGVQTAACDP